MHLRVEPLDDATWPGQFTPDDERKSTPFSASWRSTLTLLDTEVDLTANGGKHHTPAVLEVPFDRGQLYRDGSGVLERSRSPRHPGVALSFDVDGQTMRFAVDRYRGSWSGYLPDWQSNVRAIALTLQALRAVDRYGATRSGEQYRGWQALGSGTPMGAGSTMTVEEAADLLATTAHSARLAKWTTEGMIDDDGTVDSVIVRAAYRDAVRFAHPDHDGGNADLFHRVTIARDLLLGT